MPNRHNNTQLVDEQGLVGKPAIDLRIANNRNVSTRIYQPRECFLGVRNLNFRHGMNADLEQYLRQPHCITRRIRNEPDRASHSGDITAQQLLGFISGSKYPTGHGVKFDADRRQLQGRPTTFQQHLSVAGFQRLYLLR